VPEPIQSGESSAWSCREGDKRIGVITPIPRRQIDFYPGKEAAFFEFLMYFHYIDSASGQRRFLSQNSA
jgi:hypothetical protein